MSLAQGEDFEAALALAERALADAEGASAGEQAGLWYAIAVAEHVRGDTERQAGAADHCRELGEQAGAPGWISNALSMRAMARVRRGAVESALLDLARAEVELGLCTDDGLRNWAHTGLGYCYLELRLYELAQPHFEAALEIVACPLPLPESRTIDLMNLAEMHLRWADELERARPYEGADEDAVRHRALGHDHAKAALAEAERIGPAGMLANCRAAELCSRRRDEAAQSIPELRAALVSPDNLDHSGGRATVGAALARALWRLGRREEALATAREAAQHAGVAGDWQVGANVQWLLVEMEAESGNPGGVAGRDYGRLLSGVLWSQRLSTLQGARAALQVELLHRDKLDAERAANEDALTGVGNRRALDDALRAAAATEPVDGELHTSLLLVDLDDFKAVNDTHGHVVGDDVLRAVAAAVRGVARSGDLVARLGGDEFVVLARDTDATVGALLARRVTEAVHSLVVETPTGRVRLGASVGVATTGPGVGIGDLLGAADVAMYGDKARPR